ncbi:pyridoxal kinase isoform X2 [Daktulosphaira vitifoliae]|uniref:pyridoxal kinase isoform X1 n=1 Tax=Daktulosphaira vitifoliae TaxID=58002 RepID=UPI0021A9B65C|nr:pyridoxal kinase isoform X1 [Daktulosphaira vitifoliae]XP_050541028.1 pyridoxal kinase isoform X2 [Daktulosphaira vitifoliae]XP_050541029.1 pyridoxal kinase isoform X1 [Daktulosphaira vitifoliae]XP_050541030.1 pyridoxal kinase isoform X2 [Daktulosphaira vitifoliae]XP_050541031.1 pyridoxal kinase isoform X1 [Daktulosphaira vitifoliae]XP_050541032.1 pyridoxal kinase isoform X2 [Daktulosphaira vitifoliae]
MELPKRVLSIQSHVVSGYVGNKSAVFPLQVMGFEVDAINSVQLSNHTGYKLFYGQVLNEQNLMELVSGLVENDIHFYSHLLTGYIGCPKFLSKVAEVYKILKEKNPNLIFVCDPVLGDNKKMYVPEEMLDVYKNEIIFLTDIITPNEYELELLSGKIINTVKDINEAITILQNLGCKTVVVSSFNHSETNLKSVGKSIFSENIVEIDIPYIKYSFIGTGDLFAALLLLWMSLNNNNLKESMEKTIATIQAVLKRTVHYIIQANPKNFMFNKELKLIQSISDIQNPNVTIFGKLV